MKLLVALSIAMIFSNAFADRVVGNGGDGVFREGKFYLLDLVEARGDLYKDPFFSEQFKLPSPLVKRVEKIAPELSFDRSLLAQKIAEIHHWNQVWALIILKTLEKHDWIIEDRRLRNTEDEGTILTDELYQIAIRQRYRIFVDKKYYDLLDAKNRIALILHEAVYAMTSRVHQGNLIQKSWVARNINARLFSELNERAWIGIYREANKFVPLVSPTTVTYEAEEFIGTSEQIKIRLKILEKCRDGSGFYCNWYESTTLPSDMSEAKVKRKIRKHCSDWEHLFSYQSVQLEKVSLGASHSLQEHNEGFYLKIRKGKWLRAETKEIKVNKKNCSSQAVRAYRKLKNQ